MWHRVARALAADHASSCRPARLRRLDQAGAAATPELDHAQHSKRAMAADMVELMRSLGHDRFAVVGHDRGGRVAHRLALDHPSGSSAWR
jgi:haloacetate dehalogenase